MIADLHVWPCTGSDRRVAHVTYTSYQWPLQRIMPGSPGNCPQWRPALPRAVLHPSALLRPPLHPLLVALQCWSPGRPVLPECSAPGKPTDSTASKANVMCMICPCCFHQGQRWMLRQSHQSVPLPQQQQLFELLAPCIIFYSLLASDNQRNCQCQGTACPHPPSAASTPPADRRGHCNAKNPRCAAASAVRPGSRLEQ